MTPLELGASTIHHALRNSCGLKSLQFENTHNFTKHQSKHKKGRLLLRLPPDCHTCPPTGTLGWCGSAGGSGGWSDAVVRSQRVARMLQIADQAIIVAGSPVQPGAFTGLAERHPQLEKTVSLEVEARRLLTTDFSRQQLSDFIRGVCAWGGYPGTAARVLGQNA